MSNQDSQTTQSVDTLTQLPPPSGDSEKADNYITQLTHLISTDKLIVSHTDLSKFDPTSLQDHYRLDLKEYEIEVSHTKQPDSGQDYYVMLFNNLKNVSERCAEKIILAYLHLTNQQFKIFKSAAFEQLEKRKKEAEQKRFKAAMTPIDLALEQLGGSQKDDQADTNSHLTTAIDSAPPAFPSATA